jgi:hypothetical protein
MSYLVHALYNILALVPGLAARTHRPCGRMRNTLRITMGFVGAAVSATAALCGVVAYCGLRDDRFGYFLAGLLVALAAFLLIGGVGALLRAVRNPAPAPLPANVIPFHRPAPAPRRELPGYHRHFDQ